MLACQPATSLAQLPGKDQELAIIEAALLWDFGPEPPDTLYLYRQLDAHMSLAPKSVDETFGIRRTRYPVLLAAFLAANASPRTLEVAPQVGVPVHLTDDWRPQIPGVRGVYSVARPGITPAGDSALVVLNRFCVGLCGSGAILLLIRTPDGWSVRNPLLVVFY